MNGISKGHGLTVCLIAFTCPGLAGCGSVPGKPRTWASPDQVHEVRFVPGPDRSRFEITPSDYSSISYYAIANRQTGRRMGMAPSVIRDDQPGSVRLQDVHFSPTGRTIWIAEDTSDASPVHNHVLLRQAEPWEVRILKMPLRGRAGGFGYGQSPKVERISDSEVIFRYPDDESPSSLRFEEIPSARW